MKRLIVAGAAACALSFGLASAPAYAHHSFSAEFDGNKCRDFTGTLTKVEWTNPHGFFYVDVKDPESGKVDNWSFQTYALITLRRAGTTRQMFLDNVGKEVWVRGCVARNGKQHYAAAGSLKFASDGVLRQMGQLQD
jgi:Family of unknown function (DUF6152)